MSDASSGGWGSDAQDLEPQREPLPVVHEKPQVLTWLRVFYVFNALLSAAVIAGLVWVFVLANESPEDPDAQDAMLFFLVLGIMMSLPLVASIWGCFVPRRPWARTAHFVLLIMTTVFFNCIVVFSGPLIYFLLKPEVEAWYANQSET